MRGRYRHEHSAGAVAELLLYSATLQSMPDRVRLRVVPLLYRNCPEVPVLMLTECHSEALAIWALRHRPCLAALCSGIAGLHLLES